MQKKIKTKREFNNVLKNKSLPNVPKTPILKKYEKYIKRICVGALLACGLVSTLNFAMDSVAYLDAKTRGLLNFNEKIDYTNEKGFLPRRYENEPVKVKIGDGFNEKYRKEIIKAIKYVDSVVMGLEFIIVEGDSDDFNMQILKDGNMDNLGCAYPFSGTIYINDETFHMLGIKATVVHEIGHVLGLTHSKDVDSIMFPINVRSKFSKEDIENLNKIWPEKKVDYVIDENIR